MGGGLEFEFRSRFPTPFESRDLPPGAATGGALRHGHKSSEKLLGVLCNWPGALKRPWELSVFSPSRHEITRGPFLASIEQFPQRLSDENPTTTGDVG